MRVGIERVERVELKDDAWKARGVQTTWKVKWRK